LVALDAYARPAISERQVNADLGIEQRDDRLDEQPPDAVSKHGADGQIVQSGRDGLGPLGPLLRVGQEIVCQRQIPMTSGKQKSI